MNVNATATIQKARQLSLFSDQPISAQEIHKQTPLLQTLEFFIQYLRHEGKSEHTVKAFDGDIRLLGEFTSLETPIVSYNTQLLNEFLNWLEFERTDEDGKRVPCSRKTYARRVTTLKVYFKWLYNLGALSHDPAKQVLQRSGPAPLSYALTLTEIRALIEAAQRMRRNDDHDYRPELIFRLLVDTGIKKSEVERLELADIERDDYHHPTMLIRHTIRNVYKERRIALQPDWVLLLDLYTEQYHPEHRIFTCTTRNLEYILKDIATLAGVEPEKVTFETLRWTCGVRDYRAGISEDDIRDKLGLSHTTWYETGSKIRQLVDQQLRAEAL